jgi:hypothetical protein
MPKTYKKMPFAKRFPECWLCGGQAHHTHHIARGCHRAGGLKDEANLIRCCWRCHERIDNMPLARQLALVKFHNPEHYDRERVNLLRSRQPGAVTEHQVRRQVTKLAKAAGNLMPLADVLFNWSTP